MNMEMRDERGKKKRHTCVHVYIHEASHVCSMYVSCTHVCMYIYKIYMYIYICGHIYLNIYECTHTHAYHTITTPRSRTATPGTVPNNVTHLSF